MELTKASAKIHFVDALVKAGQIFFLVRKLHQSFEFMYMTSFKQSMKTKTENLSRILKFYKVSYGGDDLDILGGILLVIIFRLKKVYSF